MADASFSRTARIVRTGAYRRPHVRNPAFGRASGARLERTGVNAGIG